MAKEQPKLVPQHAGFSDSNNPFVPIRASSVPATERPKEAAALALNKPVVEPPTPTLTALAVLVELDSKIPGDTTDEGVIAPSARVIAGVVVAVATVPDTPFALTTDTLVTVPEPPPPVQPVVVTPPLASEQTAVPAVLEIVPAVAMPASVPTKGV